MEPKAPIAVGPPSPSQTLTAPQAGGREPWASPRLSILPADQTADGWSPGNDGQGVMSGS
ncbi:hypothetical protein GCM10027256_07780 [Novispirillum itersonii subsp. nipponicum]|uniref:Uncharacterized protein n=1 Tax=Novispirillum itersonii TaxID=189 RepID=A0A7W9ZJA5_NOVIT|nr:hypothetical protein [Novispirillum itersonii]